MTKKKTAPEPSRLLLSPNQAAALAFVSKDESRPLLCGVHITPEHVEATDSYRAVRITHAPGTTVNDYPVLSGNQRALGDVDATIDARSFGDALKALSKRTTLPILQRVVVVEDAERYLTLGSTDLDRTNRTEARKIEGRFPPLGDLFNDSEPVLSIKFNAGFLADIANAAKKFSDSPTPVVELRAWGPLKPAEFSARTPDGQTFRAILMPVR
jgi:hypothetical protein